MRAWVGPSGCLPMRGFEKTGAGEDPDEGDPVQASGCSVDSSPGR